MSKETAIEILNRVGAELREFYGNGEDGIVADGTLSNGRIIWVHDDGTLEVE